MYHSHPGWDKAFVERHKPFTLDSLNQAVRGRFVEQTSSNVQGEQTVLGLQIHN